jgi:hypothetical protein
MNHVLKTITVLLIGALGARVLALHSSGRAPVAHAAEVGGDASLVLSIQRSGNRDDDSKLMGALWSDGVLYFPSGKKPLFYKAEADKLAAFRKHLDDGAGVNPSRASFLVPDHESITMRS